MALLAYMSGWWKLAALYRAQRPPSGRCFLLAGGKVGDVWYRGCLTIHTSAEGLYLSVWPIFRFREPPLLIPLSDIRNRREKRWLWFRCIEFDVGSPPIGTYAPAISRIPRPTASLRNKFSVFATTPSTWSRFPASLVRFPSSRSHTPALLFCNDSRGLSRSR
jgi:hypothetical protein